VRDAAVAVLLVAGVALAVLATLGVVLMRDAFERLHYLGPATLATACMAAAVVVRESFSLIGNKAIALAVFVLVTSPVVSHVTARALHHARREDGER
jgi:multicomponent Na+:H+ antiporter subunit G